MAVKVKQRGGKWWLFIDYKGKRKAKCVGRSEDAAYDAARKIEAKLTLKQFKIEEEEQEKPPLFGKYAKEWLQTCKASGHKASTLEAYEWLIEQHLVPDWEKTALNEIARAAVRRFLVQKTESGLGRA